MRGYILFLVAMLFLFVLIWPFVSLFILGSDHSLVGKPFLWDKIFWFIPRKTSPEIAMFVVKFFFYSTIFLASLFSLLYSVQYRRRGLLVGNVMLLVIWALLLFSGWPS